MALNYPAQTDNSSPLPEENLEDCTDGTKNACLWGEFSEQDQSSGDMKTKRVSVNLTQTERDMLARLPRPLPLEGPRIHQPGSSIPNILLGNPNFQKIQNTPTSHIVPSEEIQPRDPYILGGMALQNYATELRRVLSKIEERHSIIANVGKSDNLPNIELPPVPTQLSNPLPPLTFTSKGPFQAFPLTNKKSVNSKDQKNMQFTNSTVCNAQTSSAGMIKTDNIIKNEISSVKNSSHATEHHKLSPHAHRNILRKSVASICAFQGYDIAVDAALDLLTDAASNYLKKFCLILRSNRDKQLLNCRSAENEHKTVIVGDQGFSDVMDRTFREVGNFEEGLKEIPEYYSNCVVARYQGIVSECRQLLRDCHHQTSLDAAYPNMASAGNSGSSSLQSAIQLSTGAGQSAQIVAVSAAIKSENLHEQQNMIPELHLSSNTDDFLSNEGAIYVGGGAPSILGAVLSGSQAPNTHPVHPLVHPPGTLSVSRTPTAISSVGSNNVPILSLDHNTPQIESGLQMLQSLEQGGHFTVPGSSHDGSTEDPEQSPTPILSGIVGASPVPMMELQGQSTPITQASLLIKAASALGSNSKMNDNQSNVSLSSQGRKRRKTHEDPFS